jgi:hypothetical protein
VSDLSCVRGLRDTTIPSPDHDHGPGQDVTHSREIATFFRHASRLGARPPRSISVYCTGPESAEDPGAALGVVVGGVGQAWAPPGPDLSDLGPICGAPRHASTGMGDWTNVQ